jgi:2-polyprenyl-3-methyl-5-hydroxy-6-metoxy-1,4-benzoquinol methylase
MNERHQLAERRMGAAIASGGISSGPSYKLALRLLERVAPKERMLEFGSGTGRFASMLLENGFPGKITCADILPRPGSAPGALDWIQADLNDPLALPPASFDVIVSTEVIEHLENPRAAFREFHRLLRAGGSLIVTTPNQQSIRALAALVLGGHFAAFLGASYPAHITALLAMDFERICAETGFSQPSFIYSDHGRIPKMTSVSWQQISMGLLKGRLFSDGIALLVQKTFP